MQPYSLRSLYDAYSAFTADFVLYLPRSSDLNQIARYASPDKDRKLEVTHYCMSGWSKVCFPVPFDEHEHEHDHETWNLGIERAFADDRVGHLRVFRYVGLLWRRS